MCKDFDKPRVLFADDDPDMLEMLLAAAASKGWCAQGATSGEQLLTMVNEACVEGGPCFDIVVTDIQFFSGGHDIKITGMGAAREVRDKFPNLPILFLTGYAGPMTREDAVGLGCASIMSKPVELDKLTARIEQLMGWSRGFEGAERRLSSVNRTAYSRRRTDKRLEVPKVLQRAMNAVRRAG